jgi:hypothetical protein
VLAAVGATGVENTLAAYVDERVLFASTIVAFVGATAWLALHRGVIGGLVATIAGVLIVCGKHVFFSSTLAVLGVLMLAIYVGVEAAVWRALTATVRSTFRWRFQPRSWKAG